MNLSVAQSLQFEVLGATLLSFVLGGLIGYEREAANKPAGLRTHMTLALVTLRLVHILEYRLRRETEIFNEEE